MGEKKNAGRCALTARLSVDAGPGEGDDGRNDVKAGSKRADRVYRGHGGEGLSITEIDSVAHHPHAHDSPSRMSFLDTMMADFFILPEKRVAWDPQFQ